MKKILIILAVILMFGCESRTEEQRWKDYKAKLEKAKQDSIRENRYKGFNVIVIDSCEYLIKTEIRGFGDYTTRAGYLAHKGNCKFCEERKNEREDSKLDN